MAEVVGLGLGANSRVWKFGDGLPAHRLCLCSLGIRIDGLAGERGDGDARSKREHQTCLLRHFDICLGLRPTGLNRRRHLWCRNIRIDGLAGE